MESIYVKSRDNARTPMQWDNSGYAGFTTGTPWLNVNPNCKDINVKQALEDPASIFHYYRKLIELRKQEEIIVYGDYELILEDHDSIFAYTRTLANERLLVINNLYEKETVFELPQHIQYRSKQLLINNYPVDPDMDISNVQLRPYESIVLKLFI